MKVRLKQRFTRDIATKDKFQFHEGPIKTQDFGPLQCLPCVFQFHEGPIKTDKTVTLYLDGHQVSIP